MTSSGPTTSPPRPIRDWSEIYRPLDERVLEGFGGVSEYGITVRWDKNFLTLLHLTLARRRGLRMYGGVRFGGTLPIEDAWALRLRSRRDRGRRRTADDHRHEEQPDSRDQEGQRFPDGAAADGRVQADGAAEPAGAAARRGHRRRPDGDRHRDRVDGVLPAAGREDARRSTNAGRGAGRIARARGSYDAEELEVLDEFLEHGRAVRAERARAAAAGEHAGFRAAGSIVGRRDASPIASGWSIRPPTV